jgi:hypothetical protein
MTQVQMKHDSVDEALIAVWAEVPSIPKGRSANVQGKDGKAGYSYEYADLSDLLGVLRPLLAAHGLAVLQPLSTADGRVQVATVLLHATGRLDFDPVSAPTPTDLRALGSTITYLRRYSLMAALGIATEDDDGAAAQQAAAPSRSRQQRDEPSRSGGGSGGRAPERAARSRQQAPAWQPVAVTMEEVTALDLDGVRGLVSTVLAGLPRDRRAKVKNEYLEAFQVPPADLPDRETAGRVLVWLDAMEALRLVADVAAP